MEINECIRKLKEQIVRIETLKCPPAYHPAYQLWDVTTENILKSTFDEGVVSIFHGASISRMSINERQHYSFFMETLELKKKAIEAIIQQHESSETAAPGLVGTNILRAYTLHPAIEEVAGNLFRDAHYSQAIEESFKRVISEVKTKMTAKGQGLYDGGDSLVNHAFGAENRSPAIKFNKCLTQEEKDEQKGIMFLFKGIVGIRNRKAHENIVQRDSSKVTLPRNSYQAEWLNSTHLLTLPQTPAALDSLANCAA